jgi:hypothetical protein
MEKLWHIFTSPRVSRLNLKGVEIWENGGGDSLNISLTEEGALRYFGFVTGSPHVKKEKEY